MICKNCDKEFEGKFCPDCGTSIEEPIADEIQDVETAVEEQVLSVCPDCGQERVGDGGKSNPLSNNKKEIKISLGKAGGIISKVYRYILAVGMLFVGLVGLLCLTAPTITESFMGMKNDLCSGFVAIGNGADCDVPSSVVGASRMLLILSLCAIVYGGWQLYSAIKKPYSTVKKYQYWIIDGIISIMLIILGGVVSSASKEGINGQVGSGFAMCITMGVFAIVFLAARIFYELKVFSWESTGLSQEQIAKSLEKKPKKERRCKEQLQKQVESVQSQSIVASEVELAKKRKKLLVVLDLIIALIPIIYVSIMLYLMYGPFKYDNILLRKFLLYGGISMGLVFFVSIIIRCVGEVMAYKWIDPYPKKKLTKKQKIAIPVVAIITLIAIIVPSVVVSLNTFSVNKVSQIQLKDSKDRVVQILGKPDSKGLYNYQYYSSNYIKLHNQIVKAKNNFDLEKVDELEEQLEKLTYKYIRISFNNSNQVESILLDTSRCEGNKNKKKRVKTYETINYFYGGSQVSFWVKYTDGSYFKGAAMTELKNCSYIWQDEFGNQFIESKN